MRPLLCAAFVLASGLVVGIFAPGGDASANTPGDGCLVVQEGLGKVAISLTRGVVFGRFQQGTVRIDDVVAGDGSTVRVIAGTAPLAGVKVTSPLPGAKTSDHARLYTGDEVRFRTTGAVRISVNALRIDLSVAGKGTATLSATTFEPDFSGTFSVDAASFCEDNFQQMPATATRFQISSPIAG
jgi:hypothetical protein